MAKRKRLSLPDEPFSVDLETKSAFPARARMPIAEVAGDTAGQAALEEVAREMTAAESEGRIARKLPLDQIAVHHLSRDRMVLEDDEMAALEASLRDRGQQTPVEVVRLPEDMFGLISGLRRYEALRRIGADHILALVRSPETSQAAYLAMVEENEIRANLSFYERANIAVATVGQGVYPNPRAAIAGLFAHATPAKRSKIANFVTIRERLGNALTYPTAIPEKLGLALAKALEADAKLARRISDALRKTPPVDAVAERKVLERALRKQGAASRPAASEPLAPGVSGSFRPGRVVLSGEMLTESFCEKLRDFVISHAKPES